MFFSFIQPPSPVDQPSHVRTQDDVHEIELTNTGSGFGIGLVEFKGKGVAVKTIVKGGAAAVVRNLAWKAI